MATTGIILAGGKSTRMGEDKGLVFLDGSPMITHVIEHLKEVVDEIIVIANNAEYQQFGFPVYSDLVMGKGPVGGIYTGLFYSKTEVNLCISCDAPFVSAPFLKWLLSRANSSNITLPRFNENVYQLIGVYKKSAFPIFKKNLNSDRLKLSKVNDEAGCAIVDAGKSGLLLREKEFSNMNRKSDLNKGYNDSNS
ncbi:MAG: molybdenum cofactor guanylyltransferase [Crocinitomicaceae bacterium]|jgi:molybdopterin-guanine dinucleotide biosynthesis protein A|nr:molybdenum cofactor guanylyltransferase [Crocinitomicaceae bacterium]